MRVDLSRQAQIDRQMCRPGYRWNPTLGRCVGAYAIGDGGEKAPNKPQKPTPDDAIAQESAARQSQGKV